ncbi:sulfatase-like hydrolase/transferase [Frateuria defendens]|uniref:sulfatase-like hydrolase/transferase n=1 Tax=Frateuria defendens TaxID=2219559 RepID=UPI00066FBEE9|nr:sulfatase-like hydrolase/transferase [Frateuria defendens]
MSFRPFRSVRPRAVVLACALAVFVLCVAFSAWSEPQPLQRAFVLSLMLCTSGVLLFVTGRPALTLVASGGAFLGLRFVSALKLQYLDSGLMPQDFVYYTHSSLLETLRRYPHLYGLGLAVCLSVPLLLGLTWWLDRRLFTGARRGRTFGLRLGGVALCALAFWLCLLPAGPYGRVYARSAWEKFSDDALLTNFFVYFYDSGVRLPPLAGAAQAERDWAATAPGRASVATAPYPDIVEVLEESTFDPSNFAMCQGLPECRAPHLFEPDARTRGHGVLRVHTFGGGTWVSEFAALTGLPQDVFGPGGMYAPYVLAPRMRDALAQQLERLGYLTVAVYPTNGAFLNGRNAYTAYGFSQFHDADELGLDPWEESDAQMFAAAKRVYDKVKKPGQPVFLMVLTINQHGPHDLDPLENLPPPFNRGIVPGLPAQTELNVSTYLAQLRASDRGMQQLEHDFLDRGQPTVLVHFGDHQPSFDGRIRSLPRTWPPALQPLQHYLTYYMVKSNFAGAPLPTYPALDIAYLPGMVLQAAGLPADPYFSAADALRERCDGRYTGCPVPGLLDSYHAWIFGHLHVFQ